ncbi:unnamed protein product [Paramecium sonneborni]|uniref:Uncharacterized protein n=1 Tax=Paramecium sonneborni TaxID=65129 RepID=A0A8S1RNK4_9CILI|nr:unnamed protein product [Paramecium sonneborni]
MLNKWSIGCWFEINSLWIQMIQQQRTLYCFFSDRLPDGVRRQQIYTCIRQIIIYQYIKRLMIGLTNSEAHYENLTIPKSYQQKDLNSISIPQFNYYPLHKLSKLIQQDILSAIQTKKTFSIWQFTLQFPIFQIKSTNNNILRNPYYTFIFKNNPRLLKNHFFNVFSS